MVDDPLSLVLQTTDIQSALVGGFSAGGDWAIRFPPPEKLKFFVLVKGVCWLAIDGEPLVQVGPGDVLLLATSKSYVLASNLSTAPINAVELFAGPVKTAQVGQGQDCIQIGGHIILRPSSSWAIMDLLPPVIHVQSSNTKASTLRWLLDQLILEQQTQLPGGSLAVAQLTQLMFLQVLRIHLDGLTLIPNGWLRVITDQRLAPALRLIHGAPGESLGLGVLAKASNMSRTAFAVRFRSVAGVTPLVYLAQWRMHLAQRSLKFENLPFAELASRLGYGSESAFSTAFKRVVGVSPKRFRESISSDQLTIHANGSSQALNSRLLKSFQDLP